ncbi:MAG: cyclopropane-fatty-acyl-phospholipid synthase family protein [Pseudomonadota bacterium]
MKTAAYPATKEDASGGIIARWLQRLDRRVNVGRLEIRLPNGEEVLLSGSSDLDIKADWRVHSWRALRRVVARGAIGFAEGYVAGDWDTSNLTALILFAGRNEDNFDGLGTGNRLSRLIDRLMHQRNRNSKLGSKRNIAFHYDLGNDFYRAWLDETMSYSAGVFKDPSVSLAASQVEKMDRLLRVLDLRREHRLLEIGCGWGGFLEHSAAKVGCPATGISISAEQIAFARERLASGGLDAQVLFKDYRDLDGSFDRIASIEMFEAVGEAYWPLFANNIKRLLSPQGVAAMQFITIEDSRFEAYRQTPDFIQRYIFPGGMLPSLPRFKDVMNDAGLKVTDQFSFGRDYAQTLAHWRERFLDAWPDIANDKFDEHFKRLWLYYLGYCEAGFHANRIDVVQVRLEHA